MSSGARSLRLETRTDVMLALLGAAPRSVRGMTRLVKVLFLVQREVGADQWLARGEQYYGYRPYKIGPFSADVYDDVELLEQVGLISATAGSAMGPEALEEWRAAFATEVGPEPSAEEELDRVFGLTKEGKEVALGILASLSEDQRQALRHVRDRYDTLPLRDILVYVYTRYPEMTEASEIKERLGLK